MKMKQNRESGFTLVELAIVLVIIGLIVGGVLVGQDLIKAAEIRTVVTDIEKYNAAASTFRTKYSGLPGDLTRNRASQFGLEIAGTDGSDGLGDGDSLLENGPTTKTGFGGETALAWVHLSQAGLISQGFNTADGTEDLAVADTDIPDYMPSSRLRDAMTFHIYASSGRNAFYLGNPGDITAGVIDYTSGQVLSPLEASSIDEKMDDGTPSGGIVRAVTDLGSPPVYDDGVAAAAADECVYEDQAAAGIEGGERYILDDPDFMDAPGCQLQIRASF